MVGKIVLIAAAAAILLGVASVTLAARGSDGPGHSAREAECNAQADARDFGIHQFRRHRFVIRCVAGLSH
jgi:hypothetical protein